MPFCSTDWIASRTTRSWSSSLSLSSAISTRWLSATVIFFGFGAAAERLAEDVAEIEHAHLRPGHAGDLEGRQARRGAFLHRDLDLAVVERALAQHLAEFLAGVGAGIARRPARRARGPRRRSSALASTCLRSRSRVMRDRDLDEVAGDLLDIAADIADLGELGRLDLEERRLGEPRQPARDLGLAAARSGRSSGCSSAAPPRAVRAASCWRRQRLRSAIATARLASSWPTMKRSSSETISRGLNEVMAHSFRSIPRARRTGSTRHHSGMATWIPAYAGTAMLWNSEHCVVRPAVFRG